MGSGGLQANGGARCAGAHWGGGPAEGASKIIRVRGARAVREGSRTGVEHLSGGAAGRYHWSMSEVRVLMPEVLSLVLDAPGIPPEDTKDLRSFSEIDETAAFEVCVGLLIDYKIPLSEEMLSRIHEFDDLLFDEDAEDLDALRSSTAVE